MKIIKKVFFLVLLFALGNCGYEPIYSKKISLKIESLQLNGDKSLNRKIVSSLKLKNQNEVKGYKLSLDSSKTTQVTSKDSSGDASIYKTAVNVKVSLLDKDKILKEKVFSSDFTYNNLENKFDLSQYQKEIEIILIDKIIEEIFIFLTI